MNINFLLRSSFSIIIMYPFFLIEMVNAGTLEDILKKALEEKAQKAVDDKARDLGLDVDELKSSKAEPLFFSGKAEEETFLAVANNGTSSAPSSSSFEIISFKAIPSPVEVGRDVRFYWEVKGADTVRLYNNYGEVEGRIQLDNGTFGWPLSMSGAFMTSFNKDTIYKLVAENRAGKKIIKLFRVKVKNHQLVPLKSYWSAKRGDNILCGTTACSKAANTSKYRYLRVEGCAIKAQKKGTIPLVLYWHSARKDNSSVASPRSRAEHVKTKGNRLVRTEAYIYKYKQPGTIPLKLYWFPKRTDNASVAHARSIAAQEKTKGMSYIRTEGYIYPASQCR